MLEAVIDATKVKAKSRAKRPLSLVKIEKRTMEPGGEPVAEARDRGVPTKALRKPSFKLEGKTVFWWERTLEKNRFAYGAKGKCFGPWKGSGCAFKTK